MPTSKQIKACAANGKHVFCEKPIATDVPETIEAINACKVAGVKLMTALQRRFDPNFARVRVAIADGEVGEVIQVRRQRFPPAGTPRERENTPPCCLSLGLARGRPIRRPCENFQGCA